MIACSLCHTDFRCKTGPKESKIDVYYEWIDFLRGDDSVKFLDKEKQSNVMKSLKKTAGRQKQFRVIVAD